MNLFGVSVLAVTILVVYYWARAIDALVGAVMEKFDRIVDRIASRES